MSPKLQDWPSQAPIHRENKHSYHRSPVGGRPQLRWFNVRGYFSAMLEELESEVALVSFAVIAPAVLLFFDPLLFVEESVLGTPLLGSVRTFWYLAILIGALAAVSHAASGRYPALIGGVLAASGATAWVLGFLLVPFSLIGIVFLGIGLLGFTPFITSGVLVFHSMHSMRRSTKRGKWMGFIVGFCGYFLICLGMQNRATSAKARSLEDFRCGAEECLDSGISRLRSWGPFIDSGDLGWAWARERDPRMKARLAAAYEEKTGVKLEERPWIYSD